MTVLGLLLILIGCANAFIAGKTRARSRGESLFLGLSQGLTTIVAGNLCLIIGNDPAIKSLLALRYDISDAILIGIALEIFFEWLGGFAKPTTLNLSGSTPYSIGFDI